ncbi:MAG: hypothetical protein AB7G93_22370 [Bdellovibrionales bacterium]
MTMGDRRVGGSALTGAIRRWGSTAMGLALVVGSYSAQAVQLSPELVKSKALLIDFVTWANSYTTRFESGSEQRAMKELIEIIYDLEIERPWGEAYFPEAQKRLVTLRSMVCPALTNTRLCHVPEQLNTAASVGALADVLADSTIRDALQKRWNLAIYPLAMPGSGLPYDFWAAPVDLITSEHSESTKYWTMDPKPSVWTKIVPLVSDVRSYWAGFSQQDHPSLFALTNDSEILINDFLLRDRAMKLAQVWKFRIARNHDAPLTNAVFQAEEMQWQQLFDENETTFNQAYESLLAKVSDDATVKARFLKERNNEDFPEEVYQQVAYELLLDLVKVESSFYERAQSERPDASDRQLALEMMVTLQRYAKSSRLYHLEVYRRANLIASTAAVLDQTVDPYLAITYLLEQVKAILGMEKEKYESLNLFPRYRRAVWDNELFDARYMKEYQPELLSAIMKEHGSLSKLASLPAEEQKEILKQYLFTPNGKLNPTGFYRVAGLLSTRLKPKDSRELAEIVHEARYPQYSPVSL